MQISGILVMGKIFAILTSLATNEVCVFGALTSVGALFLYERAQKS